MKILKHSRPVVLEIVLVLNDTTESLAAATNIEFREMKTEWQFTEDELEAYRNFIRSVVSVIEKRGFTVVEEYQSSKSYSYYIQFTPISYDGFEDKMLEFDVKFRISDHYNGPDTTNEATQSRGGVIFKSFIVGKVTHDNIVSTLKDIQSICDDLKVGDYSRLM